MDEQSSYSRKHTKERGIGAEERAARQTMMDLGLTLDDIARVLWGGSMLLAAIAVGYYVASNLLRSGAIMDWEPHDRG